MVSWNHLGDLFTSEDVVLMNLIGVHCNLHQAFESIRLNEFVRQLRIVLCLLFSTQGKGWLIFRLVSQLEWPTFGLFSLGGPFIRTATSVTFHIEPT